MENIYLADFHNFDQSTSDLIRIIMQQPEVVGVKLLTLDQYLDRMKVNSGVVNCLQLRNPRLYKPKFSFHDSEIMVLKRGIPLTTVDRANIEAAWLDKKNAFRESLILDSSGDLPIPEGDDQLDIAAFYSIQNEFPQTYGLREGEVVSSASPLRKAQARQLKAFLLFFEQLLTNYCAQLANIQELFSMRSDAERTYFYQPLYEVPAVKDLYLAFLEEQERDIDNDGIPDPITWEEFKQNCNAYVKALDFATEAPATFRGRRNGFIDHLLARFAEEFTDYAAWAFVQQQASVSPDLIFDKLDFLRQFPALSSERALAFNYSATGSDEEENETPDVWDSSNVSGFEKRVAALLGIPDARRRSLTEVFDINNYVKIEDDHFDFWNAPINEVDANPEAFKILLSSRNPHSEDEVRKLADLAQYAKNYKVFQVTETRLDACQYYFNLLEDNTPVAGLLEFPPNRAIPEEAIRQVIHLVQGRRTEGMHLVEHILLRPLENTNELLNPVVFDGAGTAPFISDVYSFQVSIFLPEWPPRFKDPEFQAVAERTIREELPAHIFPWIYWVQALKDSDPETGFIPLNFIRFEEALQNWLQDFNTENRGPMQDEFIKAYNELISSDDVRQAYSYNAFSLSP